MDSMWKFKHVILWKHWSSDFHQKFQFLEYISGKIRDPESRGLGIIFQNGILEHVDWEEWVWLVAFVRIYMTFTR